MNNLTQEKASEIEIKARNRLREEIKASQFSIDCDEGCMSVIGNAQLQKALAGYFTTVNKFVRRLDVEYYRRKNNE
jgi:hypothetical protein